MVPSPGPVSTTPSPVATTRAPTPPPTTTIQATPTGQGYLTYINSQYGFSISYPSGWTRQENQGTSAVVFTSPTSGMGDLPATMRVIVEDLTASPMSLEQYRAAQLAKKAGLDRFNTIYDLPYKGTNFNGWKVGYTYDSGAIMRSFEIYSIRGTLAYTIAFASRDDKFAGLSVQSDAMFRSFQFIG